METNEVTVDIYNNLTPEEIERIQEEVEIMNEEEYVSYFLAKEISEDDFDSLEVYLEYGLNPNVFIELPEQDIPLLIYATSFSVDLVQILFEFNVDYTIIIRGNNLLHFAAANNLQTLEFLLDDDMIQSNYYLNYYLNINKRNDRGHTPLMIAAMKENLQAIELLLLHGANPSLTIPFRNEQATALDLAYVMGARAGFYSRMKELIEQHKDKVEIRRERERPIRQAVSRIQRMYQPRFRKRQQAVSRIQRMYQPRFRKRRQAVSRIQQMYQPRFRKRTEAASKIQHQRKKKLTRKKVRDYPRSLRKMETYDPIMFESQNVPYYLEQDPQNFIIILPGNPPMFENTSIDSIYKQHYLKEFNQLKTFYACRQADQSLAPENILKNKKFIILTSYNFIVELPIWLENTELPIPQPKLFELVQGPMIPGMVESSLIDYPPDGNEGERLVSADHCNQLNPLPTYTLVPYSLEEDYISDFLSSIQL